MKKIILSLTSALFTCVATAQSCVSVQQVSTNYATQTVTFKLTWTGCNAANNHLNKVWCFVDFRTSDTNGTKGTWTRATMGGTPSIVNGTYTAGNTTGFYVTGVNGQSATVTVKLGNAAAMFDWCAIATDYPPNVAMLSGTTNAIKGSPHFVINNVAQSGSTYNGAIVSLTDATGCPGCIGRDVAVHTNVPCCSNLTAIGGYCRNTVLDAASTYSGCGVEIKIANNSVPGVWDNQLNCPSGWRPATYNELVCMSNNAGSEVNFCKGAAGSAGYYNYIYATTEYAAHFGWKDGSGCNTMCAPYVAVIVFDCDGWTCEPAVYGSGGHFSTRGSNCVDDLLKYSAAVKCVR